MIPLLLLALASLGASHGTERKGFRDERNGTYHKVPANRTDVLRVVDSLGGIDALAEIKGFIYHGGEYVGPLPPDDHGINSYRIYRSSSLGQTYNMNSIDQSVADSGSQTTSFQIEPSGLLSRIDRTYNYDQYWAWAFADLQPAVNMSLVIHDADEQYACFVTGTNSFEIDRNIPQGYTDRFVTDYLLHLARQLALPWLLQTFLADPSELNYYQSKETYTSKTYNTLEHPDLGLELLYDRKTGLPHAVRSHEDHVIFGSSTSDLILTDFRPVSITDSLNITLPHRMQTIYNTRFVIEDFSIDSITINPTFLKDHFEGRAPPADPEDPFQGLVPVKPQTSIEYPRSEVHEFFESGLWSGPFGEMFNTSDVVVEYPDPEFKNIMTIYVAYPDYVQILVEHNEGFIITDAAGHRSKIILSWLKENRPDKKITHVVPSHHHRDHAGGVDDYLEAGATLVVPYVARDYYSQAKRNHTRYPIITYDDDHPFVFSDSAIEFRSYWSHDNPHAEDWSFAVATKANPKNSDLFVVFVADVINPGTAALNWENDVARQFMISATEACVPLSTLLVGAHGSISGSLNNTSEALQDIAYSMGFSYPSLTAHDWKVC